MVEQTFQSGMRGRKVPSWETASPKFPDKAKRHFSKSRLLVEETFKESVRMGKVLSRGTASPKSPKVFVHVKCLFSKPRGKKGGGFCAEVMKFAVSQGVHWTLSDRDVDHRTLSDRDVDHRKMKVSLEALAESVATLPCFLPLSLAQGLGGGKSVLDGLGWIKQAVEEAFRQPAGDLWTEKGIREGPGMGCTWGWSLVKGLGRAPLSTSGLVHVRSLERSARMERVN